MCIRDRVHHAAVGWMIDTYESHFKDDQSWAMPVVAETYDGPAKDICGRHITEAHALAALNSAASGLWRKAMLVVVPA